MTTPLGTASGSVTIHTGQALASLVRLRAQSASTVGTLNQMGRAAILGGAGIAGAGALIAATFVRAAKVTADYQFKMDFLQATLGATDDEMARLNKTVLDFGTKSGFGPREIAGAFVELGKAGVSAEEIIGGVGRAVITLGQSADIGLSEASSIIVSTQATFGLLGAQAQRTADIIQGAANASLIDVSDFGTTMKYVGNVAAAENIKLEDLATAIAEIGNQGIRGSTAGTSLRRMLLQLTPRTLKAKAAMEELGIITKDGTNLFYDQTGSAKSLRDIFQVLHDKTVNLTDAKKKDALATIFGDRAVATSLAVARGGAKAYDEFNKQLNESTAAEIAAKRFDNLQGALRKFKGALESAFIVSGTSSQRPLQRLVENLTGLLKIFARLRPETQANISKFALMAAGILIMSGTVLVLFGTVLRAIAVLKQLSLVIQVATKAMGLSAAASGVLAASLTTGLLAAALLVVDVFFQMGAGAADAARKVQELTGALNFGDLTAVDNARKALDKYIQSEQEAADKAIILGHHLPTPAYFRHSAAVGEATKSYDDLNRKLFDADQNIKRLSVASGIPAQALKDAAKASHIDVSGELDDAGKALLSYYQTTIKGRVSTKNLSLAVQQMGDDASASADDVNALEEALSKVAGINLEAEGAQIAFQRSVNQAKDALTTSGRVYDKTGKLIHATAAESLDARDALLGIADAGLKVYDAQIKQEANQSELNDTLAKTRKAFIDQAVQMGMSRVAAGLYADKLGLIPPAKETKVGLKGVPKAKADIDELQAILDKIPTEIDILINTLIGGQNQSPVTQGGITDLLTAPVLHTATAPHQTIPKIPSSTSTKAPAPQFIDPATTLGGAAATLPSPDRLPSGKTISAQSLTAAPLVIPTSNQTTYELNGPVVASDPAELRRQLEKKRRVAALRGG